MYGKAGARSLRNCERSRCHFETLPDRRNIEASEGRTVLKTAEYSTRLNEQFERLESMATEPATDEADIRQRIDRCVEALRAMDLEGVMSLYASDIVSFDIVPPLRQLGAKAKEKNWMGAFAIYQRPFGYEICDFTLTLGDDVAFGHSLNRVSGTLKNGNRTDFWLRWTACFRKIDGNWLVAHDHVSVPIDPESGRALLNLEP
jgi:uncharacterized protein (TIGR02246 family)